MVRRVGGRGRSPEIRGQGQFRCAWGQPAAEIIGVANTINPDLIAVGAKGLSGIDAFLLGSVAQRVSQFARYSVLIVNTQSRQLPIPDRRRHYVKLMPPGGYR